MKGQCAERRRIHRVDHSRVQCRVDIRYGEGDGIDPHGDKRFFRNGITRPCPYFETCKIVQAADSFFRENIDISHFGPGQKLEAFFLKRFSKKIEERLVNLVYFLVISEEIGEIQHTDHGQNFSETKP